jgi:signal transduction histidine kinase
VLDRILISMERIIAYDAADILLLNATRTMARVARHRSHIDPDSAAAVMQLHIPVAQARNLREMLTSGQPVIIDDVWAETEWIKNPASAWIRSNLGFPIIVQGQPMGVLSVDQARPGAFTAADADRLRAFADQVAMAIQNAQLHDHVQRYADELELRIAERTKDLAAANERLQDLDRLKTKFVSDVSHELRTPVTSLGLYLDLMIRGKPEKRDHYLQQAITQMARLRSLIDDILDLSRLDRQHQGWNSAMLDLNEVAALVVDEQQPTAEAAGLALSSQRTLEPLRVLGDHSQMLRAIRNLVANATKYTRAGQVQVTTLDKGVRVGVQVTDTGIGIAPEDLPHVFDRFYRGQQVAQSTIPGTGLGLAIVKEIIEAHGGTVEVESELGVGSTFRLWLPAMIG